MKSTRQNCRWRGEWSNHEGFPMSEMSRELPNKNQPRPETFRELICAMDQALKARAKHLDNLEIEFQTSVIYSDHRW